MRNENETPTELHARYRGKIQIAPKVPVASLADYAIWYTPGVAEPCRAIACDPDQVWELTNRGNTIAVVSDGTRVLGLGDIGPAAGLPVMEGKALIFKLLGGVDAVPLVLDAADPDAFSATVKALAPSFRRHQPGGYRAAQVLRSVGSVAGRVGDPRLARRSAGHGDGRAGRCPERAAAGRQVAGRREDRDGGDGRGQRGELCLLTAAGADPAAVVACDELGTLHAGRDDLAAVADAPLTADAPQWRICQETNAEGVVGGAAEAIRGADVLVAFSRPGPDVIAPDWVRAMAEDAIVIAGANPTPEIWPEDAHAAGARIVGTGRSDFPNQVNNALAFPGIFRGVLDVRARRITDGMAVAAAEELARCAEIQGLREDHILPTLDEAEVAVRIAVATGLAAQAAGVARLDLDAAALRAHAERAIERGRTLAVKSTRAAASPPRAPGPSVQ